MSVEDKLTEDEKLFKHYFNENVDIFTALQDESARVGLKERGNQWALDSFDHLQRHLTKGNVSDADKAFCAKVVLWMFHIPGLKDEIFDEIEEIIGSEHFVNDLISYNDELRDVVDKL